MPRARQKAHGQAARPPVHPPVQTTGKCWSQSTKALANLGTALHEAGTKIATALRELNRREEEASSWMQRFIHREIEHRTRTRGPAYWDAMFPGLLPEERAQRRIPVQYAKRVVGRKVYGGANTYLPLRVNTAGVIKNG